MSQPVRRGIGIRHGSAARTGRDMSPYRCCRSRSDCGRRLFPGGDPVALQRGRWNGIAMRAYAVETLCERQNENAPGMESEGIRGASEDRGDRSPVEEPVRSGVRPRTRTARAGLHRAWAAMTGRRLCGGGGSWSEDRLGRCIRIARIPKGAYPTRVGQGVQAKLLRREKPSDCVFERPFQDRTHHADTRCSSMATLGSQRSS